MYDNGLGVPQDYKESVKLYRLSAEQGHASAQINLGVVFEKGLAVEWLLLAAEKGNSACDSVYGCSRRRNDSRPDRRSPETDEGVDGGAWEGMMAGINKVTR